MGVWMRRVDDRFGNGYPNIEKKTTKNRQIKYNRQNAQ
jgi:hypothetical protein